MSHNKKNTGLPNVQPFSPKSSIKIAIDSQRLRQARIASHFTLEEVSRQVSITKMTLQRYETGDIRAISPERLERLARLYGTTPSYLHGISPTQEFITDQSMTIVPCSADPSTALGRRLSIILEAFSTHSDSGREAEPK